jgi:hypothetical protein
LIWFDLIFFFSFLLFEVDFLFLLTGWLALDVDVIGHYCGLSTEGKKKDKSSTPPFRHWRPVSHVCKCHKRQPITALTQLKRGEKKQQQTTFWSKFTISVRQGRFVRLKKEIKYENLKKKNYCGWEKGPTM